MDLEVLTSLSARRKRGIYLTRKYYENQSFNHVNDVRADAMHYVCAACQSHRNDDLCAHPRQCDY